MKITTDMIIGFCLGVALILNIVLGGATEVTMNLSTGMVGFLGKVMFTRDGKTPIPQEKNEEPENDPRI